MFEAKAVSNKFWILRNNNIKVGEINISQKGYEVNINGTPSIYNSMQSLKENIEVKFFERHDTNKNYDDLIHGFPYSGDKFNEMWDLKLNLPLYTKKDDSKSWFVAGHFLVLINGKWRPILSPKLLILQRNDFKGPFKEEQQPTNKTEINHSEGEYKDEDYYFNRWFEQ